MWTLASTASRANLLEQLIVDYKNADDLRGSDFNGHPDEEQPRRDRPAPQGCRRRRGHGA
jgi:hypothetical protein